MKNVKYTYNPTTLRYETHTVPFRIKLLKIFGFLCACIVTAFLITWGVNKLFPPKLNQQIANENNTLKNNYEGITEELALLKNQLTEIENRDNKVYRTIFEAKPIPDSTRQQNIDKQTAQTINAKLSQNELVAATQANITAVKNRITAQNISFNEVEKLVANKADFLAHLPAIQPVANKELTRIASGFGVRIDPVYKTIKMHKGLDFAAPQGTPIYATANGVVTKAEYNPTGFGNHIIIDHGNGYETLYGHMVKSKAVLGTQVLRGELIGWVGSTGKSTGPHCHYEVHKNGEAVDPIYYFYNDLSPAQFDRLVQLVKTSNQSID